jgi:hypothetical protein
MGFHTVLKMGYDKNFIKKNTKRYKALTKLILIIVRRGSDDTIYAVRLIHDYIWLYGSFDFIARHQHFRFQQEFV